jgi:hypothetical protein
MPSTTDDNDGDIVGRFANALWGTTARAYGNAIVCAVTGLVNLGLALWSHHLHPRPITGSAYELNAFAFTLLGFALFCKGNGWGSPKPPTTE